MTTLRSLAANSAIRRSHWRTLGLSEADMAKPKIAVVNSSSELAVCFAHLDGVARVVKDAIRAAGGIPFEVRTTAPSDFITGAGVLRILHPGGARPRHERHRGSGGGGAAGWHGVPDVLRQDSARVI